MPIGMGRPYVLCRPTVTPGPAARSFERRHVAVVNSTGKVPPNPSGRVDENRKQRGFRRSPPSRIPTSVASELRERIMALANESAMKADLTVLEHATLAARMLGFEGSSDGLSAEKSADEAG
jgi:hypothetical protein